MLSKSLVHYGIITIVIFAFLRGPLQVVGYSFVFTISCGTIVFLFRTNRIKFIWCFTCVVLSSLDVLSSFLDAQMRFNSDNFISHEANAFLLANYNERYMVFFVVAFFSMKTVITFFLLLFSLERKKGRNNKKIWELFNAQIVSIDAIKDYYRNNERIGVINFIRDVGVCWSYKGFPNTGLDESNDLIVKNIYFLQGVTGIACFILIPINNIIVVYDLPVLLYSIVSGLLWFLIVLAFFIRPITLFLINRRIKYNQKPADN